MSLPGRLTEYHIDAAKAAGRKGLTYLHRFWSIEELEKLAGRKSTNRKPSKSTNVRDEGHDNRNGNVAKPRSDARESESHVGGVDKPV